MNPQPKILFYISGHGMGHARRMAAVIAILRQKYQVSVAVRTLAPRDIFTSIGLSSADIQPTQIDSGVIEKDVLHIDTDASINKLRQIIQSADQLIADEVRTLSDQKEYQHIRLIVADIPFLAADIAAAKNIPCIGTGNFTWDWIFEPLLENAPDGDVLLSRIRESHAKMELMIRQPFSHEMPGFKKVVEVPAVANRSKFSKDELCKILHLDQSDPRPRVLLGMRGGIEPGKMDQAVRNAPDFLFSTIGVVPHRSPENLRAISKDGLDFSDILAAHDIVISKLGYGIVTDCIANQVRLLWPRRTNFREEILFETQAPQHLPMNEISPEDYTNGNWQPALHQLANRGFPSAHIPTNGAEILAKILLDHA